MGAPEMAWARQSFSGAAFLMGAFRQPYYAFHLASADIANIRPRTPGANRYLFWGGGNWPTRPGKPPGYHAISGAYLIAGGISGVRGTYARPPANYWVSPD